ncbi:MAG: hypothetical protein B6D39_02050 [Anaerolineae bacterium UTCFX2]|jgi:fatty acid desaturase|nr:hypothetical protein [Anaerolineales bacterium]OQY94148.1 MAG: hypothetical protein B6D39_02050 [Anaerolineae bacterium UTCFX2]
MTLKKSKRSAIVLSGITVLAFTLTSAALNLLLPYLMTGDIHMLVADPESFSQPSRIASLAAFVILLLIILTGIGAFWLFRYFGEGYFGARSAYRWAIFGLFFALFLKIPDWLVSPELWLLKGVFQLIGLFAAFFLARWLIPLQPTSGCPNN